jgi:hypothetical protein
MHFRTRKSGLSSLTSSSMVKHLLLPRGSGFYGLQDASDTNDA